MERCPNCGNKLSSIDVLCPKCGAVVEVIQTKSNAPSPSETVTVNNTKNPETVQKKDIPKYFNVYYEDLPTEDSDDNESEAVNEVSEESESADQADVNKQPNSILAMIEESDSEEDKEEGRFFNKEDGAFNQNNGVFNQIVTAKVNEEQDEEDNDYSPRYLENLKNLNLPEIDDISNFDPEEYMREYKYKKILGKQTPLDDSQNARKQWLEIEETDNNLNSELTKVREDIQKQTDQTPIVERRYRGTQDSRTEKRRDNRPEKTRDNRPEIIRDNSSEKNQEIVSEELTHVSSENKKIRKPKVLSMILFWIVISVAIFFGFLYLDSSIKYSPGSYDEFIYSITNHQVNLNPGNPK